MLMFWCKQLTDRHESIAMMQGHGGQSTMTNSLGFCSRLQDCWTWASLSGSNWASLGTSLTWKDTKPFKFELPRAALHKWMNDKLNKLNKLNASKFEISFSDHKISFYHHERFDQVQIQMWHWYSRTKQESAVVHFHTDKVLSCSYEQFLINRSSTKKKRHIRISWRTVYFRFSLWCGNPALRGKKDWPSGELHDEAIVLPESTD